MTEILKTKNQMRKIVVVYQYYFFYTVMLCEFFVCVIGCFVVGY